MQLSTDLELLLIFYKRYYLQFIQPVADTEFGMNAVHSLQLDINNQTASYNMLFDYKNVFYTLNCVP